MESFHGLYRISTDYCSCVEDLWLGPHD
jgi:hypothetical protein